MSERADKLPEAPRAKVITQNEYLIKEVTPKKTQSPDGILRSRERDNAANKDFLQPLPDGGSFLPPIGKQTPGSGGEGGDMYASEEATLQVAVPDNHEPGLQMPQKAPSLE